MPPLPMTVPCGTPLKRFCLSSDWSISPVVPTSWAASVPLGYLRRYRTRR